MSWQTAARMPRILLAATDAPDARAADEDAAIGLAVDDRLTEALGEVRVVVVGVGAVAAEVDQLVPEAGAPRAAGGARP